MGRSHTSSCSAYTPWRGCRDLDSAGEPDLGADGDLDWLMSEDEAERILPAIVDWGRYAELFAYDYRTGVFSANNPGEDETAEGPVC
jgi:hypothetical protein